MSQKTITVNGKQVSFSDRDTVLDVTRRMGLAVPTLCHEPRLDPTGACRACLVEVSGSRRLLPACALPAEDGMEVVTENERIDRHRATLMSLYMTDHTQDRDTAEKGAPDHLFDMAYTYGAALDWPHMTPIRADYGDDRNPYIAFNPDTCILCARCTRYCDEVEGVSAITLAGRGAETTIAKADGVSLLDSTCEMCGGCVAVCPTGAMSEKMPLVRGAQPETQLEKVRSTCNFCGVGCQVDINVDRSQPGGRVVKITSPPPGQTTNDGNLCVKGRFAYDFLGSDERLTVPLLRGDDGELHPTTWPEALAAAAHGLMGVRERHGDNALGFVSSSRCTGEENYLVQKMSRAVFRTNNVHQCAAT